MNFYRMTHETYLALKVAGGNNREDDVFVKGYSSEYGKQFVNLVKVTKNLRLIKIFSSVRRN